MFSRIVIMASATLFFASSAHAGDVPIPRAKPEFRTGEQGNPNPGNSNTETSETDLKQPVPAFNLERAKICEAELNALGAEFSIEESIKDDEVCGWSRPLKLRAVSKSISVTGTPIVRCEIALVLAKWTKEVVQPSAQLHIKKEISSILISTSYQCRRRNNASSGKLSEHAFANGVDVMGFELVDAGKLLIEPRLGSAAPERSFQAAARAGSCSYFTTVLGPTTNASHSNHLHLDLAERRGGYRLCQ